MPKFTFLRGERIYSRADHAFDRETGTIWYRHDRVVVDGEELEGFIQVKERRRIIFGRDLGGTQLEVTTCFRQTCVQGSNPKWLMRQNKTSASLV